MRKDFKAALARVQSDYGFFVECQSDPAMALAGYSLSPDERAALVDPDVLAEVLKRGSNLRPVVTIKISGSHDWVNRAAPQQNQAVDEQIARQVESVKGSQDNDERSLATLRLIQLLG